MPLPLFGRLTGKLFKVIDSSFLTDNEDLDNTIKIDIHSLIKRWTLDALGNASFGTYRNINIKIKKRMNINLSLYKLIFILNKYYIISGFDFGSIEDSDNEWVRRFKTVLNACEDPLFALLPFLERNYLDWFPKRKQIHEELTKFLDMMQEIIDKKRDKIIQQQQLESHDKKEKNIQGLSSSTTYTDRDILTLMIENQLQQQNEEENDVLSDEELKVSIYEEYP